MILRGPFAGQASEPVHAPPRSARAAVWRAVCAQIAAVVIFATHYSVAKAFVDRVDGLAFASVRGVFGAAALLAAHWASKRFGGTPSARRLLGQTDLFTWASLRILVVYALFGYAVSQSLFMYGLEQGSAPLAAVSMSALPLVTACAAHFFFAGNPLSVPQRLALWGVAAAVMAFVAVPLFEAGGNPLSLGALALFCNTVIFGVTLAGCQPLVQKWPPQLVSASLLGVGGLMLLPLTYPLWGEVLLVATESRRFLLLFVFEVFVVSAVAWFLNLYAIRALGVVRCTYLNYVQLPVSALVSWWATGAPPGLLLTGVAALIVCAGWLILRERPHPSS